MKHKKKIIILSIAGVLLLVLWFSIVDLGKLAENLKGANHKLSIVSFIFAFAAISTRFTRWYYILAHNNIEVKYFDSVKFYLLSALADFSIPIKLGELLKAFVLKKNYSIEYSKSLATIVLDRLSDLTIFFVVLVGIPLFLGGVKAEIRYFLFSVACVFLVFLGIVIYSKVIQKRAKKSPVAFSHKWNFINRINRPLQQFIDAVGQSKIGFGFAVNCILLSALAFFFNCTSFYFIQLVFADIHLPFSVAYLGYSLLFLTYVVPAPPGYIGSQEIIGIMIFSGIFGIDKNIAATLIVYYHFLTAISFFIIALFLIRDYFPDIKRVLSK